MRATRSLPTQLPVVDTGVRACITLWGEASGGAGTATAGAALAPAAVETAGDTGASVRNVASTAFVRRLRATYIHAPSSAKATSSAIVK